MAAMNKTFIIHSVNNVNYIPALERWFVHHHCPEVMAQEPWLTRYVMYRVMPPAKGMEEMGFLNYRVHENLGLDVEGRRSLRGLLAMTPEPMEGAMTVAIANVPAEPTEDFFGRDMGHNGKAFIRFVSFMAYPKGVSREEGEEWFLNIHVPEVCKQPGLLRFFSHKAYDKFYSPIPLADDVPDFANFEGLFFKKWDRVNEMWYETNSDWTNANTVNPPAYTKPSWAKYDKYPFFEPMNDYVCTSILERPDQNMLRHYDGYIF